jgi:hypothetical protein
MVMTDREILMQRNDNSNVRQHAADMLECFNAEVDIVVEVYVVRRQFQQQLGESCGKPWIPVGKLEPVEPAGGVRILIVAEWLSDWDIGPAFPRVAAQEPSGAIGPRCKAAEPTGMQRSRRP